MDLGSEHLFFLYVLEADEKESLFSDLLEEETSNRIDIYFLSDFTLCW